METLKERIVYNNELDVYECYLYDLEEEEWKLYGVGKTKGSAQSTAYYWTADISSRYIALEDDYTCNNNKLINKGREEFYTDEYRIFDKLCFTQKKK